MSAASTMPCLRIPEIGEKYSYSKLNKRCSRSATVMPVSRMCNSHWGFRFAYIVLAYSPTSTPLFRWRNPLPGGAVEPCVPVAVYMADYQALHAPSHLGMWQHHKSAATEGGSPKLRTAAESPGIFLMARLILQCPAHEGPACFLHGSKE